MGKFSNNWKRRNGNFLGFRSIIDIVCALEILGVVLFLIAPQFVMNYLILNPAAILHGQIWRIVTFLVYPPAITGSDAIMFVLMNALGIYCIRAFGTIVGFFRNYPFLCFPTYLSFASNKRFLQRPYIVRFIIFNRLFVPSTKPLL